MLKKLKEIENANPNKHKKNNLQPGVGYSEV